MLTLDEYRDFRSHCTTPESRAQFIRLVTGEAHDVEIFATYYECAASPAPIEGVTGPTTWGAFVERFDRLGHEIRAEKDGALVSLVQLRPGTTRSNANSLQVTGVGLDGDEATKEQFEDTRRRLERDNVAYLYYTTFSHQPPKCKYRILIPLATPVLASAWRPVWRAIFERYAPWADPQCKDISRGWYCPSAPPHRAPFAELMSWPGRALDVSELIPRVDLNAPEVVDGSPIARCPEGVSPIEHACTLAKTLPVAPDGEGGGTCLFRAARALAWGLALSEEDTARVLLEHYSPRAAEAGYEKALDRENVLRRIRQASKAEGAVYSQGALLPRGGVSGDYDNLLVRDGEGRIRNLTANVVTVLARDPRWVGVLAYNELARRTECLKEAPTRIVDRPQHYGPGPWTDEHTTRLRTWFAEQIGFEPSEQCANAAVETVARANAFHPVKVYLEGLHWDGTPRIDRWLHTYLGAADTEYARLVGPKWLISAVARAYQPGCKVDTLLILEGPQGRRKSTTFLTLCADPSWFSDSPIDFESHNGAQVLSGKWLYEISELQGMGRAELNRVKAFLSSTSDNYRPSYGRRNADFPRQVVFCGTTNPDGNGYLTDTTGNRRFWPVEIVEGDLDALRRDRDQIWAEAVARYKAGERWWLEGDEADVAREEQELRTTSDPWESVLADALAEGRLQAPFTAKDALEACGVQVQHQGHAQVTRVGRVLKALGYRHVRRRSGGLRWVYVHTAGE